MTNAPIKLKVPARDREAPTRFSTAPDVARWLESLTGETLVDELLGILQELNRCILRPQARFDILEVLRPRVEQASTQLARLYLNQSPLMSREVVRASERADKLCTLLGTAYTIVAVEVLTHGGSDNAAKLACESIHRALRCSGREVLQTLQLYQPLRMHGWLNLHQLYLLAEQQSIANLPVPEPLDAGPTISAAYLQAVLLSCCQPNRLRQSDLAALHGALADWSQHVQLRPAADDATLFVVNMDSDQPPLYHDMTTGDDTERRRYIDTSRLLATLRELHATTQGTGATIEKSSRLPLNILEQVATALGTKRNRGSRRVPSQNSLSISVGMNSCHFHVAAGRIFEQVLYGVGFEVTSVINEERFVPPMPNTDLWQQANPHDDFAHLGMKHAEESVDLDNVSRARVFRDEERDGLEAILDHYPVYNAPLADVSPGGYCLELDSGFPGELRTGELVCLQEGSEDPWQIAVIRWLHRPSESRMLAGLELLSPRARAVGACIHDSNNEKAPPVRALLLPQIKLIGQPPTLLTARAGFRVRQKVSLVTAAETLKVQLTELVSYTGSYSQFKFEPVRELGDVLADENNELTGGSDSLWTTI